MAQQAYQLRPSAAEIEFFAEDTSIKILPKFSNDVFQLISGAVGPFRPSHPTEVPLWLAVMLRKRNKCTIMVPDWLQPGEH